MGSEKIVRTYEYNGRELGRLVEIGSGQNRSRHFETDLDQFDAISITREMSPEDKVHMKNKAYAVYKLLEESCLDPDDYLDNEDIMIYIADKGCRSLTELNQKDKRAWNLVKQRGLEKELFAALNPQQK